MSARGISQDPRQQWAGGCKLCVKGNKGLLNVCQRWLWPDTQHGTGADTLRPRGTKKKKGEFLTYSAPPPMQLQGCTNTLKSFFANVDILRYATILTECKLLLEKQKFDDSNKRNLKDDQHFEYLNMDKMLREHCPNECCQVERHSWNHKHPNWEASPQRWISNISSINKIHRHYDHCIAFPHLENFNSVWYFNVLNQRQNNPSVHCGLKLTCCKREKSNCDFGKVFF